MTPEQLANAYQSACMAELQALKPGNVHIFADGHGMTVHDFIKSAEVSACVIAKSGLSVGERIYMAIEATQKAVDLNTNLGVVLLCAPLIHAVICGNRALPFEQNLKDTLSTLTQKDAELTAKAIILANPAGLGKATRYDVHGPLNVTLLEMMHSAAGKDRIAWQYANAYQDIIGRGLARYHEANARLQNKAWSVTAVYLSFLAHQVDSHILRKYGEALAVEIMAEAKEIEILFLQADNPARMQKKLIDWDASLKRRKINPGTSADLTVATFLASLLV